MENSHVAALQTKHDGLERKLKDELNRPAPDIAIIQTLKKQKLLIKEELAHI
ncbi:YdcH family protein [Tsuneonella sp. HG222]